MSKYAYYIVSNDNQTQGKDISTSATGKYFAAHHNCTLYRAVEGERDEYWDEENKEWYQK